ncbi:MAG: ABC transporter ATP-binding protein [Candidatus Bathyarchaeia archaeon]
MSELLLEARNVEKFFGYGFLGRTKFPAVDNVSLALENRPKILTIAGESGCGKTTLARILLGFIKPDRGAILYKGKNIHKLGRKEKKIFRKEVQAIFQDPYETFNPLRKVDAYMVGTAKNMLGVNSKEAIARMEKVLGTVGLSIAEIAGKKPNEFSGGQLQRISIARALVAEPNLIVADEPVSMIDVSLRMNILNMFRSLREEGVSFIYITHDLATAYYISDEINIMYRGMIVERGPASEVLLKQYHPYTKALVKSLPEPGKRDKWLKEEVNPPGAEIKEFLAPGCKYADICPESAEKCRKERPPLIKVGNVEVACWIYEK